MFSFQVKIPDGPDGRGVWKQSNFGGLTVTAQEQMPGYLERQRHGFLQFFPARGQDLTECEASVNGYQQHNILEFALPGGVLVELPCHVEIRGPAGTQVVIEAWEVSGFSHRGAKSSLFAPGTADFVSGAVPDWALSFDAQGEGGQFFADAAFTQPVGVFAANATAVSIPEGARFVRMPATGNSNNPKGITFRQL